MTYRLGWVHTHQIGHEAMTYEYELPPGVLHPLGSAPPTLDDELTQVAYAAVAVVVQRQAVADPTIDVYQNDIRWLGTRYRTLVYPRHRLVQVGRVPLDGTTGASWTWDEGAL